MKIITLYLLLLVFVSCKPSLNKESILGDWTLKDSRVENEGNGLFVKTTFHENNSYSIETFVEGKLHESYWGTYYVTPQKNSITVKMGKIEFNSEVLKLTKDRLLVRRTDTKEISDLIRL